jgi:hypothetical protein
MVAACAAAALLAPAAGASTVSAPHDPAVLDPAPVTYTADPVDGNNDLTLTSDGTTLSFAESAAIIASGVGGADLADDCVATLTTSAQCPVATTTVDLGDGDDTLTLGAGLPSLTIHGGAGTDRLNFAGRTDPVSVMLGGATPGLTVDTVENVTGGDGSDKVVGDIAANDIVGGAGNDRLSGGDNADQLSGGSGVNVLRGGAGDDTLQAGGEGDTLVGGSGADTIAGGAGDDDISAADGTIDNISCGPGFDTVSADANDNIPADGTCEEVTFAAAVDPTPTPTPTPAPQPAPDPVVITDTSVVFVPVLGSIAPVLAPGPANAADLTPPGAAMRSASRQRVGTILKRGGRVPVRVTCQEACGISVALSVDRTTAKRLKLDSRTSPVVIGAASAKRALAGSSVLRVKLTSKAKAGLKTAKRNTIVTTQVLVSDASGNGTLLSRHITLVR